MGLKRVIAFANMDNTPRPFASLVAGLVNSMNWHLPLPKSRSSVKAHRSHLHLWLSQCQMVQLQMHRHTTNKVITCRVPSQPSNRTVQQRCCTVAKSELVIERWVWCHVMQVHQCRHMGKKTVVGCHEWVALRRTRKKNLKMFLDRHHFKSIVDISLLWKQSLWTKIWDFCCQQWNVSLASLFLFFVEPTESIEKAFEQTHVASVIQHFTQMQTLAQTRASLLQHVFEKLLEKRWAKSQCHPFSMSFRRFATWCQTFGQMFQGVLTQQSGSRFHNEHRQSNFVKNQDVTNTICKKRNWSLELFWRQPPTANGLWQRSSWHLQMQQQTSEQESFFVKVLFAVFCALFGPFDGKELSFDRLTVAVEFQRQWAERWEWHLLPSLCLQRRRRKLTNLICWLPSSMFVKCRMNITKPIKLHMLWNAMALLVSTWSSLTWQQSTSMVCSTRREELLSLWSWILRWSCEHSLRSVRHHVSDKQRGGVNVLDPALSAQFKTCRNSECDLATEIAPWGLAVSDNKGRSDWNKLVKPSLQNFKPFR